ncbi:MULTISPECIES: spore morphogenesis/germination protein YwcE [Aneurinibacillus]|uniref:Uncharacterized protein n=1 Tax=Aneurinibacillus thermoaerophilus TaxID=143495 RepID=A0A1G8CBS1_ANETH|nr:MULTISPECIES: spore morphogenesis/germination protein YwcE [Aneurinibacillus]AMA71573.1 hypothetical protein ACH33_01135 [Aneurinibacillus sp. XH2]MED0675412.1 spore morphogenesis/germination protein YwcE [Aneurinibacillus thermoaerophilus]MED0681205.1 spore morphogenesis/germination protein YwcE [Aneurinibacillus thermoaerophilus]MED0735445.1 spore morphogenesis/germination protein YwcE [Aneurinibacillus thermoaerophilus]MED0757304.1 spore morphogenesis/germination protein YwcE [Aneuriniba
MDLLMINLLFASVAPLLFWRWNQKVLSVLQLPFIVAMWMYLPEILPLGAPKTDSTFAWWVLFYFNLVFSNLALGMGMFRWANFVWGKESNTSHSSDERCSTLTLSSVIWLSEWECSAKRASSKGKRKKRATYSRR